MQANIVVIGAGIVGTSVAYHLTQMGVTNIVLLDKGDLDHNDGSTSHAPGGLRTLTPSKFFTILGMASRQLYDQLPLAVEGQEQFFRHGMLQVANTKARFGAHQRLHEMGMTMEIESHLLTPQEVANLQPLIDPATIYGGLYTPSSGVVKTSLIATSMRREAAKSGNLTAVANTQVVDIVIERGRVHAVLTDNPALARIDCEQVVLASNIWAPLLAAKVGVPMPLFPGEHQYIYTEPTAALEALKASESSIPVTAMDDLSIYFRQHYDRIGIGSYHHAARLVDPEKLGKEAKLPFTPEDFTAAWRLMQRHMPALSKTEVSHGFNGMFSFTADHYPILGESRVKGFWAAVGAWLSFASEVGRVMARWMTEGDPGMDVRYADINRFHAHQSNHEFLSRQSKYYYEIGFEILHPNAVASSVRNLRFAPYHTQLEALGGEFIPLAGIEAPYWYNHNQAYADQVAQQFPRRTGYDATAWSPIIGAEVLAMRETVGIVDWTSAIGPVEISGPDALPFLQKLCTANVDRPVGGVAYSLMLNAHGKIMRDVTILRLAHNRFWLLTGKSNLPAELFWIEKQAASYLAQGTVIIQNRAEEYCALALWGPSARDVLDAVTEANVSNEAFPWYTAQDIGVGMVPVKAIRISYVGELGWEIYAPVSFGRQLWDTLWEAGQAHGMRPVGIAALMSMRIEKGYRLFGADITPDETPYEAAMSWTISKHKPDFIGRDVLFAMKTNGVAQKLVTIVFDAPEALCYGFEPVLIDDQVVGRVTSAEYGYSVGKFIALAYVKSEYAALDTPVEVQYTGKRYSGVIRNSVLFDEKNERVKV